MKKIVRLLAMTGLIIYSFYVAFENRKYVSGLSMPNMDFVTKWEERIQRVKRHIPAEVTVVGYVADWNLPGVEFDAVDQDNEYVLTQYALAPIKVVPGLESEWIIGNFIDPGFRAWLDQSLPAYEISDLGFGLYLIHRIAP